MSLEKGIHYVGVNDYEIRLFEGQYLVPNGMAYNSYIIADEKTAVMDSVDKHFSAEWLANIKKLLGDKKPDYIVVQHMEPDHSACLADFLAEYPETAVVANAKAFTMMDNFFGKDLCKNKLVINDGDTLKLGERELKFIFAPMVHWPEVTVTYVDKDKTLFSADGFGKFGTLDTDEDWACEARRYYFGIVGKYGAQVQALLKKAAALDIERICPLHGPVLNENLGYYIGLYNTWSSYGVESEGVCIAFYAQKDLKKLEKFMEGKPVAEQDIGRQLLQETAAYAESSVCRRKMLLHYFGEEYLQENCHSCDNCLHPKERREAKQALLIALKAILVLKENFRQDYLVDFIAGNPTEDIVSHKHDELEEFGAGEDEDSKVWNPVIRQGIIAGYIEKEVENYGVLKVTAAGKKFMKKPVSFMIALDNEFSSYDEDELQEGGSGVLDPRLFKMLKSLRKEMSKKMNIPQYVIFQDVSLEQMATVYPVTLEELQQIQGVGAGKAKRYGKKFVELIKFHCDENEIERPEEMRVRTVAKKSMLKVKIIQSIDRQVALDDIANALGLDFDELLDELEAIVYSGTKLNIDYFLEDVMDEDHVDDLYDYFMESETDGLKVAMKELGDQYSEDELRLVRIKFISELAN